jgi:hypothetical protein
VHISSIITVSIPDVTKALLINDYQLTGNKKITYQYLILFAVTSQLLIKPKRGTWPNHFARVPDE